MDEHIIYKEESYSIMGACFEVYKEKGCGFVEPVRRFGLVRAFPEQFLKLGLYCVLAARGRARLVLWYPRIPAEEGRILVYDFTLLDLRPLASEMDERAAALREARATADYSRLPKCQPWRHKYCDYSDRCACGRRRTDPSRCTPRGRVTECRSGWRDRCGPPRARGVVGPTKPERPCPLPPSIPSSTSRR